MFFGTYLIAPGEITSLEIETSQTMQGLLLDFVKDPWSLPDAGWPAYYPNATNGGTVARFGVDNKAVQYVTGLEVEGACTYSNMTLNMSP